MMVWRRFRSSARLIAVIVGLVVMNATSGAAVASSTKVDFGDISHKGLKNLGPASSGLKLQSGLPRPGFVPTLLYSIAQHAPGSFLDITTGGNAVFGGVSCCAAGPGFDMASGLGSPLANQIVNQLHH